MDTTPELIDIGDRLAARRGISVSSTLKNSSALKSARARATRDVGFSLSQPGDSGISELAGIANQEPVHSSIWTKNAISQLLIPR